MKKLNIILSIFFLTLIFFAFVHFFKVTHQENIVKINNRAIELWTQAFGNKNNPAILLIMGSGGSGVVWTDNFCKKLMKAGFFVIRYDNRDTGKSTTVDFEKNPYNLNDMANDALAILDFYRIQKTDLIGISMGGFIGQIIASEHPDRVRRLVVVSSTPDHTALVTAVSGRDCSNMPLPAPSNENLLKYRQCHNMPKNTNEEKFKAWLQDLGKVENKAVKYGLIGVCRMQF